MSERFLYRWALIVMVVGLTAVLSGCMNLLGGLGTIVPSSGQLGQVKDMQEANLDVYVCFQIGGPPPIGGTTFIGVPKGVRPSLTWGANCQPMSAKVE